MKNRNNNKVILNLIQNLPRLSWLFSWRNSVRGRSRIKYGMTPNFNNSGFTLIELLVVVLIIGILAAVALPQYQKAVWKSRSAQLYTLVKALSTAQETYFMANGTYATRFDELDLSFENLALKTSVETPTTSSDDAIRGTDDIELIVNNGGSFVWSRGQFRQGPYLAAGITFVHKGAASLVGNIYCTEAVAKVSPAGKFCKNVMGSSATPIISAGARFYKL